MNPDERRDLEFLLIVSKDTLADWYHKMPVEEIDYAMDLLKRAYEENAALLEQYEVMDLSMANAVLDKFRL